MDEKKAPRAHVQIPARTEHIATAYICLWPIVLLSVISIFILPCLSIASLKRSFFRHCVVDDDGDRFEVRDVLIVFVASHSKKRLASGSNWAALFWKQPSRQLASLRVERSAGLCFNFIRSSIMFGVVLFLCSISSASRTVARKFSIGGLYVRAGEGVAWHSKNWQKLHWLIVFHVSILGDWSVVWGLSPPNTPRRRDWLHRVYCVLAKVASRCNNVLRP